MSSVIATTVEEYRELRKQLAYQVYFEDEQVRIFADFIGAPETGEIGAPLTHVLEEFSFEIERAAFAYERRRDGAKNPSAVPQAMGDAIATAEKLQEFLQDDDLDDWVDLYTSERVIKAKDVAAQNGQMSLIAIRGLIPELVSGLRQAADYAAQHEPYDLERVGARFAATGLYADLLRIWENYGSSEVEIGSFLLFVTDVVRVLDPAVANEEQFEARVRGWWKDRRRGRGASKPEVQIVMS
jgi:hypothetical protein